jgi:ABC transporter with metal-binding/Fe-S-binding domain ATP-binding protein
VRLAALFSGGKDSTFSIYNLRRMGHDVACLLTIIPRSENSMLFHFPNIKITTYLALALQTPLSQFESSDPTVEIERDVLKNALVHAKSKYFIEGIVHGGISSVFQRKVFEQVCNELNLSVFSPIWGADPTTYMFELLESDFEIVITGVACQGLDSEWLGRVLDLKAFGELKQISNKYGVNLNFEGGEAETLVTDCPIYKKKVRIRQGVRRWFGDRGIFEIREVGLEPK